jgi:hypothetical protein
MLSFGDDDALAWVMIGGVFVASFVLWLPVIGHLA